MGSIEIELLDFQHNISVYAGPPATSSAPSYLCPPLQWVDEAKDGWQNKRCFLADLQVKGYLG